MRKVKHFILVTVIVVLLASCAFILPVSPQVPGVLTVVMWCDTDELYTEWEVHNDYFLCTESGTIWRFAN